MNRIFWLLFILVFSPWLGFAQGEADISIELVTPKSELEPGRIHTIVYKIKNNSIAVKTVTPGLRLPAEWKVISELKHLTINPGTQQIMLVSFNIPAKYLAGDYTLDLILVDPSDYQKTIATLNSVLKVKEEPILTLELAEAPEFLKAGEEINANYIVRNTGNSAQMVTFESYGCDVIGLNSVELHPGESDIIKVFSPTDPNLTYMSRKSFYLIAKGKGFKTEPLYGFVKILPGMEEENDLYHRLPVSVTTRYLAKGREGSYQKGYQFEVSGAGTLDEKGKHKLEFLGRGPNQFDMSLLGLYDEYSLHYSNNFLDLTVGDATYTFTQLTENARYGTGFESKVNLTENTGAGLIFVKPRFYDKIKSEYGAYGTVGFLKKNTVGLHFLNKQMPGVAENIQLISLTTKLQLLEHTNFDIELSQGYFGSLKDNAYRFEFNSQISKLSSSAYYIHTGKNYPGYYTNSDFYSGYLNYNPTDWVSLGVSARQDFINAEQDTLFLSAPFSRQYQGIVVFRIGKESFLRSYVRQGENEDRSQSKKFHYETKAFNLSWSQRISKIGYNLEGEYGKTKNFLLDAGGDQKNTFYGLGNIFYNPGDRLFLQANVSYSNIRSFIAAEQNNWIFGVNIASNITKKLRANLQFQNSYSIEDYYTNRDLFELNIDYQFLKNHKISATSYYTLFQTEISKPEFSFMVSYTFNMGIPLKKVAEAGTVSGRIINRGVGNIKGILLSLSGKTIATNELGEFEFKNIRPGTYNLFIDRSTIELLDIPDVATPIEVIVEGNKNTIIEFGLIQASKISGNIVVEQPANEPANTELVIYGNVVLELTRDNESFRIISDSQGRFSFPLVRPGKWFMKVYSSGIDKQYVFEKDYFDLEMAAGEQKEIILRLQKKKRNIIFQNNNINLSSGSKK